MKNQQIADKDEQIKRKQFEAKINSSEAEIIKLNATIEKNELKSSRIIDLETQIKEYQRQLTNKTEDIKAFTVRIQLLETETNKSRDELISTKEEIEKCHAKINDQEVEIKHGQDQLAIKEGLLKAFESTVREKESQFKNLTSETELLRRKYEASSCLPFVNSTNVHSIRLFDTDPFIVHCCSNVSGSGWTLIQRRVNANENFNRSWADYKMGFGDLRENFFLGLEKIHRMTLLQPHELYIQLQDGNGSTRYARYDDFKIGSEEEAYELISLGKYSGTAGDSLTKFQLNMKFSTLDRDNDANVKRNCAKMFGGGWWFSACGKSHLNGNYYKDGTCEVRDGIIWATWKDYDFTISLTFSQMMIRQKTL
ncbi:fibrinogen-like protein 1 [Drosophila pseudoobscura]|uniref:Fibrinogen-like protein 1 n=1 Tax=Drosophila pseudoobscura pseudoobscura TaxID=46245 RepID=A0A6I8UWZ3_DROPS|nr:fibrinogen-like protein 1 [Drosophila pseudoobscura]